MKFTSKLAFKMILSDNIMLYSIYVFVAALIMAGYYKYYEVYGPDYFFDGLKISSVLLWFCVAWAPILFVISLCRLSAIKKFIENGIEIWGSVTEINRGSWQFKTLAKINIAYKYNEASYLIQKKVRLVRELKHLTIGDRIHLVIDPDDPKRFILLGA